MSDLSAPSDPGLPSYLTNESLAVENLLAEIARQAPPPQDNNDEIAKLKAKFLSQDEAARANNGIYGNDDDDDDAYAADQERQDQTSLVANSAIEPLVRLIRSETIRRRFLHKFVIARSGRYESAAERVLHLCKLLEQYPHLSIHYDIDIIKAMNVNCMELFPLKQCERHNGAVLMYLKASRVDWDKVEVEHFEKMVFWLFFVLIMMPNHAAQRNGVVMQICGEDCGPSNIKISFELFCMRLMSQCLPMRMMGCYCYNFNRFFRWVVWPPLKLAIPNKIIDRTVFTDDSDEIEKKVGAGDLHHRFGGHWRPNSIPSESDLAFIMQWTTDGKVVLPQEISSRLDKQETGGRDPRDDASGKLPENRKVY